MSVRERAIIVADSCCKAAMARVLSARVVFGSWRLAVAVGDWRSCEVGVGGVSSRQRLRGDT